jgi:hypothetical protein
VTGPDDQLARLQLVVDGALRDAGDLHLRLRPVLREIARQRLRRRRIDLDRDPRAPGLLGPEAWELVRPDRPRPAAGFAPGLEEAQLERILAALEEL